VPRSGGASWCRSTRPAGRGQAASQSAPSPPAWPEQVGNLVGDLGIQAERRPLWEFWIIEGI
jgi:hypothetical protein